MPVIAQELTVTGLRVAYRSAAPVVDDVDLTVPAGTLTALLGPSGCGKTTLLRTVAGLLTPQAGEILVAGASVRGLPAERRPVGSVFQKPLLFPHLSVGDNIAFGLRMRGTARRARRRRVAEMLDLVQLPDLAARRVGELSGGQEQRIALARALVLDPQVLLLDEPFSQLDADLRARMRELLRGIQRELSITTLFVTHDQQEAVDIADRIALMIDGRIEAHGSPADFYTRPATLRAARFFGATNEIPGTLSGSTFTCRLGPLEVAPGAPDGPGVLVARPEALRLDVPAGPGRAGDDSVAATVLDVRFRGTHQSAVVLLRDAVPVSVTVPVELRIEAGDEVTVRLPPAACHVLPADPPVPGSRRSNPTEPLTESEPSRA
jgi:putative spermidine/putrescine transport system ATP-binding protein